MAGEGWHRLLSCQKSFFSHSGNPGVRSRQGASLPLFPPTSFCRVPGQPASLAQLIHQAVFFWFHKPLFFFRDQVGCSFLRNPSLTLSGTPGQLLLRAPTAPPRTLHHHSDLPHLDEVSVSLPGFEGRSECSSLLYTQHPARTGWRTGSGEMSEQLKGRMKASREGCWRSGQVDGVWMVGWMAR